MTEHTDPMSARVGILSAAHVHAPGLAHNARQAEGAELAGVWDDNATRGQQAAKDWDTRWFDDLGDLLDACDAVIICSENNSHARHVEAACQAGRHILCEKPVAVSKADCDWIAHEVKASGIVFMTAFPCPFSPAFTQLQQRVHDGVLGKVVGWNTTNQGTCPHGWFVEPALSGGGALVDHVVHVTDLLRRLTKSEPVWVQAFTGCGMYGKAWDDIAMVTLGFGDGSFATIDSSWSKIDYKTWGNVRLKAVGTAGTAEADLFGQGPDLYKGGHSHLGGGSDLNQLMVQEFVDAIREKRQPVSSLQDGLATSRVIRAGMASAKQKGIRVDL